MNPLLSLSWPRHRRGNANRHFACETIYFVAVLCWYAGVCFNTKGHGGWRRLETYLRQDSGFAVCRKSKLPTHLHFKPLIDASLLSSLQVSWLLFGGMHMTIQTPAAKKFESPNSKPLNTPRPLGSRKPSYEEPFFRTAGACGTAAEIQRISTCAPDKPSECNR